jgi:NitT/TauT family transport system substrate-binding protein
MTRSSRAIALLFSLSLVMVLLLTAGCTAATKPTGQTGESQTSEKPAPLKIGTLPTEDSLPLWVAEQRGYFATQGMTDVQIVSFQSAQERDAAFAAGAIDAYMGDIIAAANLEAGGKPTTIATIMLGADQSQGRFGIVAAPKSGIETLSSLADVPVGTSSATIQEYVLDGLMAEAGVATSSVKVEEVKKVPVRLELLMAGKIKAAALPEPFLTLAEQGGAPLVASDTSATANLSQTVLVFSDKYLAEPGGAAAEAGVLKAWDIAVNDINKDPQAVLPLLVEKARLPESLATTYKVNTYPTAQVPAKAQVEAVLAWMKDKGYLKGDVTYESLVSGSASK